MGRPREMLLPQLSGFPQGKLSSSAPGLCPLIGAPGTRADCRRTCACALACPCSSPVGASSPHARGTSVTQRGHSPRPQTEWGDAYSSEAPSAGPSPSSSFPSTSALVRGNCDVVDFPCHFPLGLSSCDGRGDVLLTGSIRDRDRSYHKPKVSTFKYWLHITYAVTNMPATPGPYEWGQGEKRGANFQQLALSWTTKDCILNAVLGWLASSSACGDEESVLCGQLRLPETSMSAC